MIEESTIGHLHPITSVIREVVSIFDQIGFSVVDGPELETEFYNFDALNIPPDHPARDMQDTFWVKKRGKSRSSDEEPDGDRLVLRTHTSPLQVRFMQAMNKSPKPSKIIVPGKVYRNEATDATHEAQFYQVECLYMNKSVSMSELKGTLEYFFKEFLGHDTKIRFRTSYFGFVEPGVEVDVWWRNPTKPDQDGRWLEMFGAGLVHPRVFLAAGIDPDEWQGFAFGGGIDRLVLLRYGVDDVRHLYSGDLRLINQF